MSALVKIIKNPFEEENVINITLNEEKCICEIGGFDPNNSVSYVNGKHVTNDYKLKDGDVCVIRQYPSVVSASTVAAVTAGVIFLFTGAEIVSALTTGKTLGQNIKEGVQKLLKNWLMPDTDLTSNNNSTNQIENLPSLAGSKNQSALGKAIPLILGKTLFTPYVIGKPYNTISGTDGEDEYYHSLYLVGYHNLKIENVSIGLYSLATNVEDVESGALTIDSEKFPYSTHQTQLELQQGANEVSLYPCKVVQENKQMQLKNVEGTGAWFYAHSARYAKKVEIEFTLSGLIKYDKENGSKKDAEAKVVVEYSLDGGETWTNCSNLIDFTNKTGDSAYVPDDGGYIRFKNQKSKTLRYVLRQELTKVQMDSCYAKVVQYRIKRLNAESIESNVIDKVYVTAIRTWCYNATKTKKWAEEHPEEDVHPLIDQEPMVAEKRNKTARLGFSIKVSEDVVDYFDEINLIATSKARTWNKNTKKWSTTLSATRNPVELALYAMTGDFRDTPYRYEIDDTGSAPTCEKIDLDDFGAKAEICDEIKNFGTESDPHEDNRYYCDGAVLNSTKSVDLVNQILSTARSCLVLNGKKYGIFMDKEQEYPLLVLNNNNLLSLSYSKNFEEIPDAQQVKYISALNYYQHDTIVVNPDPNVEITSDSKLESVEYPFIIDPYHAKAMSLYKQACRTNRPETFVAEVTTEGGLAEIGSLIEIQSDRLLIGIGEGAEITHLITEDDEIVGIQTDGKFIVTDTTKSYGVVINIVDELGNTKTLKKRLSPFNQTGTYSDLYFETPISTDSAELPEEGCVLSFGFYADETLETICIGKSEKGDGKYELTLVPYAPEVFMADEGMIADFDPKVTPPSESGMPISYGDKTVPATMLDLNEVRSELSQHISDLSEYTIQLTMSAIGSNVRIVVYKDGALAENILYFQDFYGTGTNEPSTAGETGEITEGTANIEAVANANKHLVKVYSDEEMLDLVGTAFVSYGSTGSGSDSTSYWMIEDATSIKKDSSGSFTPSKINVSCKKQTGTSAPESYTGRIKIEYSTDGSTYTEGYSGDASSKEYTIPANTKSLRVSMYVAGGTTVLLDQDVIPVVNDGTDGGYQDYQFAVGDFGLTDEQARALDWYDAPPQVPDGKCLYMATKFIGA